MITENKQGELQTHTAFSSCVSRRRSDRPPTRCSGFLCVCLQSRSPQWLAWAGECGAGAGGDSAHRSLRKPSPGITRPPRLGWLSGQTPALACPLQTSPHPPRAVSCPFPGPLWGRGGCVPSATVGHFGEPGRAQWPFSLPVGYLTRQNKIYAAFPGPPRASPAKV